MARHARRARRVLGRRRRRERRPAVFQRAHGWADREARRANDLETAFNLGSINKIFTATSIRQLAAQGKLHLDSTLARYWPDYPNADVARRVTIRQLLEHRSGIGGNVFDPPPGGTRADLRHNREVRPRPRVPKPVAARTIFHSFSPVAGST
ncbi:MAG: beta-lactamase family protein, partial [Gemmatimonadetes bacterium]|nr:beta-lactamase family protein [Gemmatimonadota bacterium]